MGMGKTWKREEEGGLKLTLQKTRMMPPKKQMVPRSFCLREKKRNVF